MYKRYPKRDLKPSQLVLRFAPSPTGFLHLGSVFTSLIGRKLADQSNGICILRIEDTDKKREVVEGGVDLIIDGLKGFGIEFDESVRKGKYGPYIQSERLEIYHVFAKYLVSIGGAYPCFCIFPRSWRKLELNRMRVELEQDTTVSGLNGEMQI